MELFIYDSTNYGVAELSYNMFLGYYVIVHWPIIPVNIMIILKEISMEWFVFMQESVPHKAIPLRETETDLVWLIPFYANPLTYIDYLW